MTDDHRLWPKDAPDQPQQMPTPLPQKTWQKIGERMQTELDLRDKEAGDGADALKQQVKAANRSRRSYRDFLRRFCVLREEVKLDPDEFDLNFYTYGLSVYGNLPLIEPLESRESKKIEELALVIDTSYSTSGELVRAFLAETYTLLKGQENFFHRMNLHLIQADNAIRQDILIHNEDELIHAMNHFELRGGGGTDFRPAFAYVDQLCAEKKFSNLRGLLYFTDGMGTYPARRPGYDTAFLFLAREVAGRYAEILVDEYQDTNRVQEAIYSAISREGRNVFLVGDVKQSIYRFRLADPTIFLEKYRTFAEEPAEGESRRILLSDNFRSHAEILSAANDVFRLTMTERTGGLVYGDAEALRANRTFPDMGQPAVELHAIDYSPAGDGAPPDRVSVLRRFAGGYQAAYETV